MRNADRLSLSLWLRRRSQLLFILFIGVLALREVGCGYRLDPASVPKSASGLSVSVTPKSATISQGATLRLSAAVTGYKLDSTVQWSITGPSVGTLVPSGSSAVYTAPATIVANPVIVMIHVRSNEDTSKYADAQITITKPIDTTQHPQILLTPMSVTIQVGKTQQFTANVSGSTNTGVTWMMMSGSGSISSAGLYTAPTSISGSSTQAIIRATSVADQSVFAQATITVVPPPDTTPCFTRDIQPLINSNCTMSGCHSGGGGEARDLTTYSGIMGYVRVGNANASRLYTVLSGSGDNKMPPNGNTPLNSAQKALIALWINDGAKNTSCPIDTSGGCDTTAITYSAFVSPLLQNYCLGCHSGSNPSGGINLSSYAGVQAVATNGQLVGGLLGTPPYFIMPQTGAPLDACTIAKIRAWVNHGAQNN